MRRTSWGEEHDMSVSGRGNGMFESLHLVGASTVRDLKKDVCGWNMVLEGRMAQGVVREAGIFVDPSRTLDIAPEREREWHELICTLENVLEDDKRGNLENRKEAVAVV